MEELQAAGGVIMNNVNGMNEKGEYTVRDVAAMDQQLDVLFQSLAKIADSVQQTAAKYKVPMDSKDTDKHLEPMFKDLAGKQEALIGNLEYMNDQARMINPKAVEVNEQILHS